MSQQQPPPHQANVTVDLYDLGQLAEALNLPSRTPPAEIVRRAAQVMGDVAASYIAVNGCQPWWRS